MAKPYESYRSASVFGFIHHGSMPALISADGRWWWDGTQWRSRAVDGPLDLFWFASTPDWIQRVIVTDLIGLIPIVGSINMLGWALASTDMVHSGWKEFPPAGFQHLERGVAPFIVSLVYSLVLAVVVTVLVVFAVFLGLSGRTQIVIAIGIGFVVFLLLVAWWLAALYFFAAVLIGSDRLGIAKAIDPRRLYTLARANHHASLHVALLYGAATIVYAAISVTVGVIIPFGGLLLAIGLPAVYALVVPTLASFRVDA
jgi:Protein of unknown function (DUF4013)